MINNEEEGKGRSAKRPRERLKTQIFPTDNEREASRCGQDWLRDRELLVLYRYQTSWSMPRESKYVYKLIDRKYVLVESDRVFGEGVLNQNDRGILLLLSVYRRAPQSLPGTTSFSCPL